MATKPKAQDGTGRSAADYELGRADERLVSAPIEHGHDYADKDHAHSYALEGHEHSAAPKHEHEPHAHPMPKHDHGDLLGHLKGAVRALLIVIEAGNVNSEQRKAIHAVRVIIGDAHGSACEHENVAYETGDILICQDCRANVTPDAGG